MSVLVKKAQESVRVLACDEDELCQCPEMIQ